MLSIANAAKQIGVSPVTLRRWEKKNIINPDRTPGNHRRYRLDQLQSIYQAKTYSESNLGNEPTQNTYTKQGKKRENKIEDPRKIAIYARVSQPIQKKNGDLDRQIDFLKTKCIEKPMEIGGIYADVASGLNAKRRGLWKMLKDVSMGQYKEIYVTYPDRLSRFCVEYIENYAALFKCNMKFVEISENRPPQQELIEDLIAIVTCFAGKLHGSRSHKHKKTLSQMSNVDGINDKKQQQYFDKK